MITIDGTQYRNLQEQVFKNQSDIANIVLGGKLLGQLGIKVLGQYDTADELYAAHPPQTYDGDYGDAYLVGIAEPYSFYIFTRPFQNETFPQWFNLGPFPVAGPAGPEGPEGQRGPEGPRGNTIHSGNVPPTVGGIPDLKSGDYYLNTTTKILYKYEYGYFKAEVVLEGKQGPQGIQGPQGPIGPQGPQGIQGPVGEPGAAVIIAGKLPSVDGLPSPSEDIRNNAYIIPVNGVEHIFGITGIDSLMWTDLGPFGGGGSIVYANGAVQGTWDSDVKLNKSSDNNIVYINSGTTPSTINFSIAQDPFTMVMRNGYGCIGTADPVNPYDAINYRTMVEEHQSIISTILETIYPVGSIYMNDVTSTHPYDLFGFGEWERITDHLLYGCSGNDIPVGSNLGSWSHNHALGSNGYAKIYMGGLPGISTSTYGLAMNHRNVDEYTSTRAYTVSGQATNPVKYDYTDNATITATTLGGTTDSTGSIASPTVPIHACYMWRRVS